MGRTARPAREGATEADLLAVEGPVRDAVRARLAGRTDLDADDVVQETLARVWAARWRLERATLLAYALVVARNLVSSADRADEVRRRHRHRLVDGSPDGDPSLAVLAAEERAALARGLAALREDDRRLLVEHEVAGVEARALAAADRVPAGTVAARLARARARLRVEHLLALRRVTLPTPRCRGVLDAISLGDRSRQRTLRAAEHLAGCPTCAALAEPLVSRRRSLTALAPLALLLLLLRWVKAHPVASLGAGAGAAATGVAVVVATGGPPPAPPRPPAPVAQLRVGDTAVLPAGSVGVMRDMVGRAAAVQAVPADEGFWVGSGPGHRVWVQLRVRGESAVTVRPGQRASFPATVVRAARDTPARVGLTAGEGSAELLRTGAYLEVDPARLVLH
jgi:RNA polymerase sigma factor (sigma-70 family)